MLVSVILTLVLLVLAIYILQLLPGDADIKRVIQILCVVVAMIFILRFMGYGNL